MGIVNKKPTNKNDLGDNSTNNILDEIAIKYGTDKSSLWHNYTRHYFKYFSRLREKRLKILEIGVAQGRSLKMWEAFFPNAEIFAIDTNPDCLKSANERVKIFIGDQADEELLKSFAEKAGGDFDIIIDDGGHFMHQQITSFRILFRYLNAGGIYVIEDLCTSYWEKFGGGFRKSYTTVEFLKDLIDELNNRGKQECGNPAKISYSLEEDELTYFTRHVDSIHFYLSICFIFKRGSDQIIRSLDGNPEVQVEAAVRCSIILPAGNDSAKLSAYLHRLDDMRLPSDFEVIIVNDQGLEIDERQLRKFLPALRVLNTDGLSTEKLLFDTGAMAAEGRFLLLVRGFINFDKLTLEESIGDLESSGEKLSVSTHQNFVLMKSPLYPAKTNLGDHGERVDICHKENINFDKLGMNQKNHYRRYEYAKSIISPGKIVGDFACGTGYGSVMLSEKSTRVIGVDINEKVIKQIKVRYKSVQNVEFVHANLLDLKYQSLFDYIVSFETIEHLKEDDIPKLLGVFSRALKPDGTLILSTPYMEERSSEAIKRGFHLTFYIDEAKIQQWLSANGLVCEFFKYQNRQRHCVQDHIDKKDFIICVARSCKNAIPKEQIPKDSILTPAFNSGEISLTNDKLEEHRSKTVSIIIPVFNNLPYTKQCLQSLIENTAMKSYQLIIVDKGSTDGVKEFLKCIRASVKIISNGENLGFAKACNQGAAAADGNYLVFLNNDTRVQPGWLEELIKVLENDSEVGAVGSKLLYPDGSVQHAGVAILENKGKNPLSARHVFTRQPRDSDFVNVPMVFQVVTAGCMAVRKSDFESVDGFDESYWNGFEDVDLCFKLLKKGKKVVYQPKSVATHYESKGDEERFKRIRQNSQLLREKWAGKIEADIVINGCRVQEGISRAIQPYVMRDSPATISRSHYMNALISWVKNYYVGGNRLPAKKLRLAIKTCTPSRQNHGWGDTYFANSLAKAFVNWGHKCQVHFRDEWDQPDNHTDIVVHIKGLFRYVPKPYNFNILWIINHPELHTFEEMSQYDVVFCASKLYFENLKNNVKIPCFYLPQATDDEVFNPSKNNSTKDIDLLFVGNNYYKGRKGRKIIQDILEVGKQYNLCVVGQGWRNFLDDRYIKAEFVEWGKLPELYARAKIVLNDHQETMRRFGFVNNRTFDLAALKAFQISNYVEGIEEFGIVTYRTPEDLQRKLDYFLYNKNEREEFAQISNELCAGYTFVNAAREILSVINRLFNERNSRKMTDNEIPCSKIKSVDIVSATHTRGPKADKSTLEAPSYPHPKVSIITSCYNSETFLPECLNSIRNQTMHDWELFLLDDGSTDGTKRIIEEYCGTDKKIKPYYFQDNKGPYVRINFAIERANSDFIVIHEADDIMSPAKLEMLYGQVTADDRLAVVGSYFRLFMDEFKGLQYTDCHKPPLEHSEILARLSSWQRPVSHGSAIIRKELFGAIGLYDENPFGSDTFWSAKLGEYAKHVPNVRFKNVPEYLTLVRVHSNCQTGLLPCFDPRSRRIRFHQYCECKLRKVRQKMQALPNADIAEELRNCVCSDFLERFKNHIIRWESEPLSRNVIPELLKNAIWQFNKTFYVTCLVMLNGIEVMAPNIARRFKNYDLLRAMAFLALDMRQDCRRYAEKEIENHDNIAARKLLTDYFEQNLHRDVQNWSAEQAGLCDLQMVEGQEQMSNSSLTYAGVGEASGVLFRHRAF